jgi:hypothetical protein
MSRRYIGSDGNYLGAELVYGASYGERLVQLSNNTLNEEVYLLENRKVGVEWLHHFNNRLSLKLRGEFGQRELSFDPGAFVWISSAQAALYVRF